jgi:hypothetical protein
LFSGAIEYLTRTIKIDPVKRFTQLQKDDMYTIEELEALPEEDLWHLTFIGYDLAVINREEALKQLNHSPKDKLLLEKILRYFEYRRNKEKERVKCK